MIGFDRLNPMQQKAVLKTEGPVLVLAGAGSGKTGALTVRIAHLIENGVKPWNILAITFTNKAAKEMRERVNGLIGDKDQDIWVSTFHSTCVRILRRDIDKIDYSRDFSIYDTDDQEKMMKEVFKRLNFSIMDKTFSIKMALAEISKQKEELVSWEDYEKKTDKDIRKVRFAKAYRIYQKLLKENNALDFDDLIYKTVQLFRTNPDVLEYYQDKFKYIMVDEYQDTNTSQYELVRMLSEKYKNICVVGDDDQSIYGWRGANIRNILEFEKDFQNTEVIKLEQNYRSTKTILDAANSVIHNNTKRKDKTLWTENDKGSIIHVKKADNEYDEARFVADKINELAVKGERKYKDFAVLYRANAQSRALEDCFVKKSIPYRLFGGVRFYERKEIKDILSYLKVIANPADTIALKRIINVPKRGLGEASIDKVEVFASENNISLYEAMSHIDEITDLKTRAKKFKEFYEVMKSIEEDAENLSVPELIDSVITKTGYVQILEDEGTDEALARIENIDEFVSKASEYEKNADEPSLRGFLEDIALVADIDNYNEDDDCVSLMTMHSAKGLEFPYVFIVGMEEGMFPSYRVMMYGTNDDMEEERRLCYVGITRAKEELFLVHAKSRMQHGITQYNAISRFLKEIPMELVEMPIKAQSSEVSDYIRKSEMKIKPTFTRPTPYGGLSGIQKKPVSNSMPSPKNVTLEYEVGDKVRAPKYGIGTVKSITPGGADFEVEVSFGDKGVKKFMAGLSKLKKVSE
ncbi:DNA helicase PcrA [Tyzzerella sp. An114]|uniref:DNA helicase PcrA n=1 Tax=Tyzzerella sp. An114 TaxID=1965545 RepID=UPI000B432B7C|nr:DNA helicase PcrA [Tyzzerella sp. An114]OUQ59568.1 DNA helicase PcrA [Tyzzerella sp. An114]